MNRRKMLAFLPAVPFAGKAAADAAIAELAGIRVPALGVSVGGDNCPSASCVPDGGGVQAKAFKAAWQVPELRAKMESVIYEQNRRIYYLDHDLASKRSFSMAAKITFQRQREVERDLRNDWFDDAPWNRRNGLIKELMDRFNPFGSKQ